MRKFMISVAMVSLLFIYFYVNRQGVIIIDVHYNGHTAEVLVDRLPFSGWAKIKWWEKNQDEIRHEYHIPDGDAGPFLITVYAFGEGYKEEGKEDRRCFSEVKGPRNCIDKNILMSIWSARDGSVKYKL